MTHQHLRDGRSFVLVLIDADADDYIVGVFPPCLSFTYASANIDCITSSPQFRKRFLDEGKAGGRDAADELNARVQDYVKTLKSSSDNPEVIVRAYADVQNLHAACVRNGKMKGSTDLRLFIHGFNQRLAMFDFADVGPGKEGADNKVRSMVGFENLEN